MIVAGGRSFVATNTQKHILMEFAERHDVTHVVTGGCSGADQVGKRFCERYGHQYVEFPVSKMQWKVIGKSAGPRRNRSMAEYADLLFLFPGGKGTASMKAIAEDEGLVIFECPNQEAAR